MPDPARLPAIPTFAPSVGSTPGLDVLAAAASGQLSTKGPQPAVQRDVASLPSLHTMGPYNPAATLPPRVVQKLLSLEFVEMAELRADIWPEDPSPAETANPQRRPGKPPVTNVRTWLDCYARMAAVMATRFPEKAPELWAYQTTILHAAHAYEGANWVAYDRLFRREMLAKKDLNWSVINSRLYSEAFTGRAKRHPQCPHCLSEDHMGTGCPHNPYPPVLGWFQGPPQFQLGPPAGQPQPSPLVTPKPPASQEICRNFNANRCRFARCRFCHICSTCSGRHPALQCTQHPVPSGNQGQGGQPRSRITTQTRFNRPHPYAPNPNQGSEQV